MCGQIGRQAPEQWKPPRPEGKGNCVKRPGWGLSLTSPRLCSGPGINLVWVFPDEKLTCPVAGGRGARPSLVPGWQGSWGLRVHGAVPSSPLWVH